MTEMKRITVSLPDELVEAIEKIKERPEYKGKPFSAILRSLVERGLELTGGAA